MTEPKIRFKRDDGSDFSDWEEMRLGDHLIQFTDITTENNQYPALTSSRKGIFLQENYFNRQVASEDNTGYNIVPYGYFTYRHMSDDAVFHFNINYIVENGIVSTLYPVFTTDSVIDDNFLQHYLNESPSFAKYCIMQKQGGSRTYMYFKKLSAYAGYIPSLSEQQKIAYFLSNVDEVIAASEEEVANLEQQKKAVMQKVFSQEVRFKKEDGSDFPDWEESTVGSHTKMFNGDRGKNYPSSADYVQDGLPFVNAGDLNGTTVSDNCAKISVEKYNQLGGAKLELNDILYCLRGSLGKKGIVDFTTGGTVASSLVAIRAVDVNYKYLFYFLDSNLEYEQRILCDEGAAQPNLSARNVSGYKIPIPHPDEQQLIADFLTSYDEAITAAKQELAKWKELKKGLLQQMFV